MFDNLREEVQGVQDEQDAKFQSASSTLSGPITSRPRRFLGMTSIQRFVIAFLFMAAVCVLGVMLLFISGKIGI